MSRSQTPLQTGSVFSFRKPEGYASSVREAHFLGIDWRTLCLVGVGIPQQISGCARIPEISAKEQTLLFVELKYREEGCIRVALRRPLARTKVNRPGIRDHGQID